MANLTAIEVEDREFLLDVRDVMALCRVGRTTAYEIIRSIPRVRIPGGLRVRRRDLEQWIEDRLEVGGSLRP
jgi:predicted DNA-binding transcriptional regulator AlpA